MLPAHLQAQLALGYTLLTFVGGKVFLSKSDATFQGSAEADPCFIVVDLRKFLAQYQALVGDQTTFTQRELAKAAGVSMPTIDSWKLRCMVGPSIKAADGRGTQAIYSTLDCFASALAGALRRKGIHLPLAVRACRYIRFGACAEVAV